ncbi:MAG: hypothetical protein AAF039_09765 [Bacteroidota bacterium]
MAKKEISELREKIAEIAGMEGVLKSKSFDEIAPYIITGKALNFTVNEGTRILQKYEGPGSPTTICERTRLIDFCGWETTNEEGEAVFRLSDFNCPRTDAVTIYDIPINIVATSRIEVAIMTIQARIDPDDRNDIIITCKSYGPEGNALGNVLFNWRLLVPGTSSPIIS